jgi:serine/threonine protein kinase
MTAESTERSQELTHLRSLAKRCQGNLSSRYIVQLLDRFTHQGPNGRHLCLVFELLGPSVDAVVQDYNDGGDRLDAETILKISGQLLEAISFMHGFGFAHGGMVSDIYNLHAYLFVSILLTSGKISVAEMPPSAAIACRICQKKASLRFLEPRNQRSWFELMASHWTMVCPVI